MSSLQQASSVFIQPDNSLLRPDLISTSVWLVCVCFLLGFKTEAGSVFFFPILNTELIWYSG